jgi:hypothetical protein
MFMPTTKNPVSEEETGLEKFSLEKSGFQGRNRVGKVGLRVVPASSARRQLG